MNHFLLIRAIFLYNKSNTESDFGDKHTLNTRYTLWFALFHIYLLPPCSSRVFSRQNPHRSLSDEQIQALSKYFFLVSRHLRRATLSSYAYQENQEIMYPLFVRARQLSSIVIITQQYLSGNQQESANYHSSRSTRKTTYSHS